ncbi:hypothetical protein C8J57DRAFT_1124328 [Mycena rebaudengoi]|nr:hypothetical protein C8J57DRAFT_1124328 [Mycena rebaudengoi]
MPMSIYQRPPPPTASFSGIIQRLFRLSLWMSLCMGREYGLPFLIIYQIWLAYAELDDPWSTIFMLLFPLPWHFSIPAPLPVTCFDTTPGAFYRRHTENIRMLRRHKLFQYRDTQTRALYRLYDVICMGDEVEIKHEAVYIWLQHSWRLSVWPDPRDPDPDRYTMLAGIVEELVRAFNWRLERGFHRDIDKERQMTGRERRKRVPLPLESPPDWPTAVPPARQKILLLTDAARVILGENAETIRDPPVTAFDRRNIRVMAGALFFA